MGLIGLIGGFREEEGWVIDGGWMVEVARISSRWHNLCCQHGLNSRACAFRMSY